MSTPELSRLGARLLLMLVAVAALPSVAAATPADTLVIGDVGEPATLDPQAATTPAEFRVLAPIYEGLVRFRRGTMEIEPALAERWTIAPDGLTYRFELKPGVRFQDGTPVDAAAVAFTFQRLLDPKQADTGAFPLAYVFSAVESVAAIGTTVVEFRLSEPYAPLLAALATPTGSILSPAAVRSAGADLGRRPVGTGPFRLAEWRPGAGITLVRSPSHRGGAASLAKAAFLPMPDPAERLAALKEGRIDVMTEPARAALPALRRAKDPVLVETVAPHLWFLILNTQEGVFSDKRVRQAANYAIDTAAIAEDILGGAARGAAGPVPSAFGALAGGTAPYPHDPDKARALIREAGAEGRSVTFLAAKDGAGMLEPVAMAERIAADLAAVGLDARVETYAWNSFLSNVNPGLAGRADMAEMAWTVFDPDTLPYLALRSGARPGAGGFNTGAYANPEVDARLEDGRRASDPSRRAKLYAEVQRIVHDDAPFVFVVEGKIGLLAAPAVEGLTLEPTGVIDFDGATKR